MKHTFYLTAPDDTKLYNVAWQVDNPKGVVIFVHGYAEHIERYDYEAEKFNEAGYSVFGYDHRAHGRSDGKDCYIQDFDQYCLDLKEVINYLAPTVPLYIYGHSVGALITIKYLLDHQTDEVAQIQGLLFTGAALQVSKDLSPILQKLSGILGRLTPKLKAVKLPADGMSKVPEEVEKYNNDPYNYRGGIYARSGFEILKATKQVNERLHEVTLPFLAMHGSDDKIIDKDGTIQLHKAAKSEDKTLKIWEGLAHEISRSYDKEQVLGTMTSWIDERIRG